MDMLVQLPLSTRSRISRSISTTSCPSVCCLKGATQWYPACWVPRRSDLTSFILVLLRLHVIYLYTYIYCINMIQINNTKRNTKKFDTSSPGQQWLWSESTDDRGFNTIFNLGPGRNPRTLVAFVELEDLVPIIRQATSPFSSQYHHYQEFFRLLHVQAYVVGATQCYPVARFAPYLSLFILILFRSHRSG